MADRAGFKKEVTAAINANVPIVLVESFEWERVEGILAQVTRGLQFAYMKVTTERKLRLYDQETKRWVTDHPMISGISEAPLDDIIRWVRDDLEEPAVLHIEDFHHEFSGGELEIYQQAQNDAHGVAWGLICFWRELARMKPARNKTIIMSGASLESFPDLEKEVLSVKLDLPEVNELGIIYDRVLRTQKLDQGGPDERRRVIEAARGLTVMEAQTAFSIAGLNNGNRLDSAAIPMIIRQKRHLLRNSGVLDYFEPNVNIEDVGGLTNLKSWLEERKSALTHEAREFGIEAPKGLMLLGVPGCGKSLTAKAIASMWEYPLVRFDLSKVFGSLVGQTESQMRRALDVAEAVAPCILWIDEIEKGMAGAGSSGDLDSGVTARTFGILLTWMQEKTSPVFVVATSNRVQNLPAESIRKGRFDEIFFVDLPSEEVRAEILRKKVQALGGQSNTNADDIDYGVIANNTELFSGAELEQLVKDALFKAFKDGKRPLSTEDLLNVALDTYPLAITMREDISALRAFAHNRAQPADGTDIVSNVVEIPEEENPFAQDG